MPEEIAQLKERIEELETIIYGTNRSDIIFDRKLRISDGRNLQVGTTTGTKYGIATDQKQGWFNATPLIQQTTTSQTAASFVANSSGISNDTATWDAYTIGDIVAILRAYGFLA